MAKQASKKRLVLIDAHAIIHRAYHALPEFASSKGEPTGALYGLATMLMRLIADFKPDYIAACYDLPGKTFRHDAYEHYKAGRKKIDDALATQIGTSRSVFESFNIPIYDYPGFEADDLLGTIAKQFQNVKDLEIIIASGDMDTMQLIDGERVKVFTLKKGINDTALYDEKAIIERFGFTPKQIPDFKGLKGDPSDNIIGVAGIGDKTATTLIKEFGTVEGIYKALKKDKSAFKKIGITDRIVGLLEEHEEEALFSKTLAEIRCDAPIAFLLPDHTWQEGFSAPKVKELFTALEFKTLGERLMRLLGGGTVEKPENKAENPQSDVVRTEEINEEEIKKTGIALWVLNSDITTPTLEEILDYAGTKSFAEAKEKVFADLKKEKLEHVYETIEVPLIPIIEAAQKYGILIDVPYFKKIGIAYHKTLAEIEKAIYAFAGRTFNVNSPKQLGEVLFDEMNLVVKGLKKTAGGARSTRESELEKLKDAHPIIEKILEYRELQKLLSTYVDVIPLMVDKDNRLHTTLNQAGTTTGRMSSNNPNLQNIPVRGEFGKEIRRGFIAAPKHSFVACDYSQIEMRILAMLSGDKQLVAIFKDGKDVHTSVAALVFKVPEGEVTADMRRKAKVINFGIIYGMGVNALRTNLGGTREEAQTFYDNYFKALPTIRDYFEKVKNEALKKGYTETFFGRRRYFPGLKSKIPYVRAMAERMAVNAPLQGTAADVVKIAMHEIDTELSKRKLHDKIHLMLQVHDELIYEVAEDILDEARELIKKVMELAIETKLPLSANVSAGKNWASLV